nr:hypothetical protein CFP56_56469 [Quercus suber]
MDGWMKEESRLDEAMRKDSVHFIRSALPMPVSGNVLPGAGHPGLCAVLRGPLCVRERRGRGFGEGKEKRGGAVGRTKDKRHVAYDRVLGIPLR